MASFNELVTTLASSAEAVFNTFTVAAVGGKLPIEGVWTGVKSDMEKIMPGALVTFKVDQGEDTRFGYVVPGALRTRGGRLEVKISPDGTTNGSWYDSDKLAATFSGIMLGVTSGLSS